MSQMGHGIYVCYFKKSLLYICKYSSALEFSNIV